MEPLERARYVLGWNAGAGIADDDLGRTAVGRGADAHLLQKPTTSTSSSRPVTEAPAADWNLSRRVRTATSIQVNDPVVLTLEDPALWNYPWIYMVEGGNLRLKETEVPILREFLLRGGTLTFDDFHGPIEWANVERELKRVFPDRKIIDLPPDHPVFSCFYKMDGFPQTPGLGSFLQGRTWEKGGYVATLRAIEDDTGRAMVLINWNTDMGDGWEWSNATEYPGYVKFTAQAYRMEINEIIYSLTH